MVKQKKDRMRPGTKRRHRSALLAAGGVACVLGIISPAPVYGRTGAGEVSTLAGSAGNSRKDGIPEEAGFASPWGILVLDKSVWVADTGNGSIRSYHGNRIVTQADGIKETDPYGRAIGVSIDGGISTAALGTPWDLVQLADGRTIFTDRESHTLRVMEDGWVYTLCGEQEGYQEGKGQAAAFSSPSGIAIDETGNSMYVADLGNHCIRRVDRNGVTSLVAGVPGHAGYEDGAAETALFQDPISVAVAADGSIYVSDTGNSRIRRIKDGVVTTVADGQGVFLAPGGITVAGDENGGNTVVFTDMDLHQILACNPDGTIQVVSGTGEAGQKDGTLQEATFCLPGDVEWRRGFLYVADTGNNALRVIEWSPSMMAAGERRSADEQGD